MHKYLITLIGWFAVISFAICFSACSVRAVQEAQAVVTQADSLRMQGQAYSDSAQLSQAYCTLHRRRAFYPDAYAHCCYHYGRLLRAHDDPVAAMQVFINATHSRTRDYAILGRIYSNFGEMAHLAGEFELSYDMFERCGEMFLITGDTVAYCYALNDMAFELAELKDKARTIALLDSIIPVCSNGLFISDAWLTKARLYFNVAQYDSTLYYTNVLSYSYNYMESSCYVLKAQAFDRLGVVDSALYYANYVLSPPTASYQDRYNMLYITTHYNPEIENVELLEITSHRADIGLTLDNAHARHAQASEILRQELKKKANWTWLYAVCLTLIIIGLCIWGYVRKKSRQHQLLSQQVSELKNINLTAQQQHEQIVQEHAEYKNNIVAQIDKTCAVFYKSPHLQQDLHWSDYNKMCEIVNQQFFFLAQKLQSIHLLTEREIRLCILVLIGITNSKRLADMLLYSESGIRNFKNRTAKKLNTNSIELRNHLLKIVAGE